MAAAAPRSIDPKRLPRLRAGAQLLDRPLRISDPVEAVREAGFIQAQDPNAARLGVRARARGQTAAAVDRAREEGALLRGWVMRGTLHLFPAADSFWLVPLYAERELRWSRRRIEELLGFDARVQARAVKRIGRLLEREGRASRQAVLEDLERGGIDSRGQNAAHHLARLAVLEGVACMGPEQNGKTTYVLAREWLGSQARFEPDRAMEELARRHLAAFGPADERDMAAWSGLAMGACRDAMTRIGKELSEVRVGGERRWVPRSRPPRAPRRPLVRMLPAFDNHLMGHSSRDIAVPAAQLKRVWPGAGIVRATVLVDGVAVATWGARRAGGAIRITLDPFAPLEPSVAAAVEREVAEIGRFEGLEARLA